MVKRDARFLSPEAQAELRRRVINAVGGGMTQAATAQWLADVYPKIATRAKRERARIYWGDETGLHSDDVRERSFAPVGQPAVVQVPGRRFGSNVISPLTNKGEMSFMVFEGRFQAPVFIAFCER